MVLEQSFKFLPRNLNAQQRRVSTYVAAVLLAAFVLAISNSVLPAVETAQSTPPQDATSHGNHFQSGSQSQANPSSLTPVTGPVDSTRNDLYTTTTALVNNAGNRANATFVIACGSQVNDAVAEMRPLLTSMLVLATAPIRLVFLTDASGAVRIQRLFATDLARFRWSLRVDIVSVRESDIDKFALAVRVDPAGDHRTGRWALSKLMVPWLLPGVSKVAIVDTDMVFVKDPLELWDEFDEGDSEWVYRMPLNGRSGNDDICSCVVLVRCDLARRLQMHPTMYLNGLASVSGEERKWYSTKKKLWQPAHGDQGLLWITMHKYPKAFSELPLRWNREKCHNYYWVFKPESRGDVGIFHRNCAGTDSRTAVDDASKIFDFFLEYRWHWLKASRKRGKPVEVRNWDNSMPAVAG